MLPFILYGCSDKTPGKSVTGDRQVDCIARFSNVSQPPVGDSGGTDGVEGGYLFDLSKVAGPERASLMKTGFGRGTPSLTLVQGNPEPAIAQFKADKPTKQGRFLIAGDLMFGTLLSDRLPHPSDAVRYGCSLEPRYGSLQSLSVFFSQASRPDRR